MNIANERVYKLIGEEVLIETNMKDTAQQVHKQCMSSLRSR